MRLLSFTLLLLFASGCGIESKTPLEGALETPEGQELLEALQEVQPGSANAATESTDVTEGEMAVPDENSLDDVLKMVQDGSAILVDVRSDEEWDEHHFKAAKHIPIDKINEDAAGALAEVKKEQLVFLH